MPNPEAKASEPSSEVLYSEESANHLSLEGKKLPELKKLLEKHQNQQIQAENELSLLNQQNVVLTVSLNQQIADYHAAEQKYDGTTALAEAMAKARDQLSQTEMTIMDNLHIINRAKELLVTLDTEKQQITEKIKAIESFKEEVLLEYNYSLAGNSKIKYPARLIRTYDGVVVEYNGKRVPLNTEAASMTLPEILQKYKTATSDEIGRLSYVLLALNRKQSRPQDSVITFELDSVTGLSRYETHNDGPGGAIPYDHPGIGMFVPK